MRIIFIIIFTSLCLLAWPLQAAQEGGWLAQVKAADGINREEAGVIAREFFHRYISACGQLGEAKEKEGAFEFPAYLGKKGKLAADPLVIDKVSGAVSMKEYSAPLSFTDIESQPPLEDFTKGCPASGPEDILAWEYWLQQERDVNMYCPPLDYYTLNLEKEDYPSEARTLAAYQRFGFCKYGNPATIFAVFTTERSAKRKACAEEQLAQVRAGKAYDLQELPTEGTPSIPMKRFKLVSPHFAAVVYTTVYDIETYDFWVDRSYEILRRAERMAVDCLYLKK